MHTRISNYRVTTYVIAWMLQTLSMAPSLIYTVSFSLRKIIQISLCKKLSSAGGAEHPTWTEHIMITPRNAVAFVIIHPQVSKRETRG